ncbi:MAG: hypothetical protein HY934_02855 [Candidatus Firestonebacteria bacterium]|nr:hypothetical protein [Candidatus Firestonebacteria bacterium]
MNKIINLKTNTSAKISIPNISKTIFLRKRLFELVSSNNRPITWIYGPAGSGKTSLAASYICSLKIPCLWYHIDESDEQIANFFYYMTEAIKNISPKQKPLPLLTPEYLLNIPTFTRCYFEEFYKRIISKNKEKFILVFDNYQNIAIESEFHKIINTGLSILSQNISVIFISRLESPPVFARLQANEKIHYIGWDELKFSINEFKEIISSCSIKNITPETIKQLYSKTDGWIAGLVLLLENAKRKNIDYNVLDKLKHQEIFNYFINEVFEKSDKDIQNFLLKTSFLPKFSAQVAEKITNNKNTEKILSFLYNNQYFIVKQIQQEPIYWYHTLFREFLLIKANDFYSEKDILKFKKTSALFLEENGQFEYAAMLFEDIHEWDGLIQLIIKHAMTFISQGRSKTVENWISKIPEEIFENNAWLLYWAGICQQVFNPDKSIILLENAFNKFKSQSDKTGLFLSWGSIVDTITFRLGDMHLLDDCINSIKEFLHINKALPSLEIDSHVSTCMFVCLFYRQPEHPDLGKWMKRALLLSEKKINIDFQVLTAIFVSIYFLIIGDFFQFEIISNKLKQTDNLPPFALIRLKLNEALYFSLIGSLNNCLSIVSEALKISQNTGINLLDHQFLCYGAFSAISCRDFQKVDEILKQMELLVDKVGAFEKAIHYFVIAWYSLIQGNISRALFNQEIALKMANQSGFLFSEAISHFNMAQIYCKMGKNKEALHHLYKCEEINMKIKSKLIEYMCLLLEAYLIFKKDTEMKGFEFLEKAMLLGREKEFYNFLGFCPDMILEICLKALERGIEIEYVQKLVKKRNLIPDTPPIEIYNWPWELKIYTLGGFQLVIDNKPVSFSGKVQKKPLELLKASIILGKENSKDRIIDFLWPESDGDIAQISFKTTLHRLRKLIKNDNVIQFQDGVLFIDSRYSWVDAWAFEQIVENIENMEYKTKDKEQIIEQAEKAVLLYRGHFLPGDMDISWVIPKREQLINKFSNLVLKIGNYHIENKNWQKAKECFQNGIEITNIQEEFYQHLMICYKKIGQNTSAIALYQQLKNILTSTHGTSPSKDTESIYQSLIK